MFLLLRTFRPIVILAFIYTQNLAKIPTFYCMLFSGESPESNVIQKHPQFYYDSTFFRVIGQSIKLYHCLCYVVLLY